MSRDSAFFKAARRSKPGQSHWRIAIAASCATLAASPCAAQGIIDARIVDEKAFIDRFDPLTEVSGTPIAGIVFESSATARSVRQLYARLPSHTRGRLCLRLRSQDGTYTGRLEYEVDADSDDEQIVRLNYPSEHLRELAALARSGELAASLSEGECETRKRTDAVDLVVGLAPPNLEERALRVFLNSRDASQATIVVTAVGSSEGEEGKATSCRKVGGARTAFDFICDVDLPSDMGGELTITVKRTKRGLPARPFDARLRY